MRLTKLKIAGFKSFVDPTTVTFPSSLTGVVGPNGCGKSNIIDAVRWVMGEISAKHLRGDSMADVIFNGSATRKPLGSGVGGAGVRQQRRQDRRPVRGYNEVALRRMVSRDGTSDYFINGVKVRRKDITQLFLGTGLGIAQLRHHRARHDIAGHRGKARRSARLPRGSRRHFALQGAAPRDREAASLTRAKTWSA
jgi:chromosome segregation protein